MKKLVGLLAGLLAVMLIAFCGCSSKVPSRPKNTNLEFWITENVKDFDWSEYEEISGWFGAKQYYGKNYSKADEEGYYVKYKVTAWPDYADGGDYITNIYITDPEINVYGLTVNSTFDEFEKVFKKKNFEISQSDRGGSRARITASNKKVWFRLQKGIPSGKMEFVIGAYVSNRDNILF